MCQDGRRAIESIIKRGFEFDKDSNGELLYTKEAAHSRSRILHAGGDATGRFLHLFLMRQNSFPLMHQTIVTDLLVEDGRCYGARIYKDGAFENIYAKNTIIASGGIGSLYEYHTNAKTISADLHGICLEKGFELLDMEMLQFHPTVFINTKTPQKQLLTEALRGEGACVIDIDGKRFLFEYDKRGELSPRDVISRAMFDKKIKTKSEVYLSFEKFTETQFRKRFPTIYFNLKDLGFDLPRDNVPISPAFHYAMGGIKCDLDGRVKGAKNLFAIGEAACMRVHGANRLASNSLLEGLVFSTRAVEAILSSDTSDFNKKDFEQKDEVLLVEGDKILKNELRALMWENAGIIRKRKNLELALKRVEEMLKLQIGKLLRLRLLTSKEIIKSALRRKNSLGAHYIIDNKKD